MSGKDPDDILDEAIHEGPEYPDEIEEAWEEQDPMEGEAPTA